MHVKAKTNLARLDRAAKQTKESSAAGSLCCGAVSPVRILVRIPTGEVEISAQSVLRCPHPTMAMLVFF
jgi:hypothetical protein